jgi:hypothetical protein
VKKSAAAERLTEKRQFLVHIDADLIRRTKILALDRRVSASSLVQAAVTEFLTQHVPAKPNADRSEATQCF